MNKHKTQWDRSLGTSKRDQGVPTPKRPKTFHQRRAAAHAQNMQGVIEVDGAAKLAQLLGRT